MSGRVAALGEPIRVQGFALAGALSVAAEEPEAVRRAWESLPHDVVVVVLSPAAAGALGERRRARRGILTVVMPE
jgi:vacuolar-type H+-ATPase subunit F/Vma7